MAKVERILLVEDEDSLRQLLQKYLSRLEYDVDAVASAEEALAVLEQQPDRYSLLLADLTLPGMPGDKLMGIVLESSATTRVLLSSGYDYDLSTLGTGVRHRAAFLQKPYLPRQLVDEITRLLNATPRAVTA